MRHEAGERLARHCHRHGFAAVVLKGGYVEAGDRGRHAVGAGDVLIHQAFESHLDSFAPRGAEVLILPFEAANDQAALAGVADADALARLAERDAEAAARLLEQTLAAARQGEADWPDILARTLRERPQTALSAWADAIGLRPESVSRGFRLAYGVTPAAYRATARARAAWLAVTSSDQALAEIAIDTGFADQSHMTRAVHSLTGHPPGSWRRAA
jgi:AraC-like DNA-binding protein